MDTYVAVEAAEYLLSLLDDPGTEGQPEAAETYVLRRVAGNPATTAG